MTPYAIKHSHRADSFLSGEPQTRMFDPENKGDTNMADKTLICKDCSKEFVFTDGEQEFYKEKGLQNEPQRCPDCRKAKKAEFNRNRFQRSY